MVKPWQNNTGVKVTKKNLEEIFAGVDAIAKSEVLVGFPDETADRKQEADEEKKPITNAAIAYIQDNGAPEMKIPQREFMRPGVAEAEKLVQAHLQGALKAAMRGKVEIAEGQMHGAGMAAKVAIQRKINEGIPPPLSEATLRRRAAKGRKGATYELQRRAKGLDPIIGMQLAKPLIDTGQLRNAVTYVIRSRKDRRR